MSAAGGPRIGLALGGGSARGLAHIIMLEAFDELGLQPAAIAGTSIGAIIGGLYAAGISAAEIRAFGEDLLSTRSEVFRRLAKSYGDLPSLWSVRRPSVVDGVTLFELLMPRRLRCDFASLKIPFNVLAVDYFAMEQVSIGDGPVIPAIAASAALPTIMRPVVIGGRVLVDGGFANPTPWDVVQPKVDFTVAVDVTGQTNLSRGLDPPKTIDAWVGCTQIMFRTITALKLEAHPPDLMIRPAVGTFGTMDFIKIRDVFAASQHAKDELKRGLERLIS